MKLTWNALVGVVIGAFVALIVTGTVVAWAQGSHYDDAGGGGAAFTGDLAGNDLEDSTDNKVDLAATEQLCGTAATCMDLSTDDLVVFDSDASGSNAMDLHLGSGSLNHRLVSASTTLEFHNGATNMSRLEAQRLQLRTTQATSDITMDIQGNQILMIDPPNGTICWDDDATSGITALLCIGARYTNSTKGYFMAGDPSWNDNTPRAMKMGDMNTASRTLVACAADLEGVINCDRDLSGNDDTSRCVVCLKENSGGAYTYRWATIADHYLEAKWNNGVTATTISVVGDGNWVDVAGGAAGESSGFDVSGTTFTVQEASEQRYLCTVSVCFDSGTGSTDYEWALEIDDGVTPVYECNVLRDLGSGAANDIGCGANSCILDVDNDDILTLQVQQVAGTSANPTLREGSVVCRSL